MFSGSFRHGGQKNKQHRQCFTVDPGLIILLSSRHLRRFVPFKRSNMLRICTLSDFGIF